MSNPLTSVQFEIPFHAINAEHVEPAFDELIAEARQAVDTIAAISDPRTYDNTLGALEDATERISWTSSVVSHLESVATYPAFREAYDAIQPKLAEFGTWVILHEGLWAALKAYATTDDAQALRGPRQRFLEKTLDDFRRHGAELDADGKARLYDLNRELAEITTKFAQNLLDGTNRYEKIITDEGHLAGLPESAVEAARANAAAKGLEGWRFTLQAPSYVPLMTYLDDRDIRREVWEAFDRRTVAGDLDNRGLIARILELRKAKAALLGYPDFADLVLEERMAKNGRTAQTFVEALREKTVRFFDRENAALLRFARDRDPALDRLEPWDLAYWAEKQRKALYDFDQEALRPYFPVERVMQGVFDIAQQLFAIRIEHVEDMPVWDQAVRTYRVVDPDGRHRASFYVDLYPRENKRGGAWMHGIITARPPSPHLGLICGNLNPPVGDKPALLTHVEVETIFHEFGHLLHHCLSDVPVRSLGGTSVAWDFVELPSQIMENWCWEREALDRFARDWQTDAPIPEDLFEKMVRAKTYRAANAQMRQTGFAAVDLLLHREYDPAADGDVMTYARGILQRYTPVELPDEHGFLATFGHLFSDGVGYAAGYYSYKWAEVLDADAFTRFRETGVLSPETGRAFREKILAKGDSADPMSLYVDFMGREPKIEPLLERQGLLATVEGGDAVN